MTECKYCGIGSPFPIYAYTYKYTGGRPVDISTVWVNVNFCPYCGTKVQNKVPDIEHSCNDCSVREFCKSMFKDEKHLCKNWIGEEE